ncbi:MAG TPA: hypothetical protein VJH95_06610 [Candidatus Nanoarchaeia archaeon]|nr:hypothetical protein [Candidatus Nanoarchaeia archaeon]
MILAILRAMEKKGQFEGVIRIILQMIVILLILYVGYAVIKALTKG